MEKLKIKVILATDIKWFTVKSSLLPYKDLDNFLKKHDEIIWTVKDFNWEIIKNVWDGYMIFFSNISNALDAIKNIMSKVKEYNSNFDNDLNKIELRMSLNIWEVLKKEILVWVDYFWEPINFVYRLLDITPANSVYVTEAIYNTANRWIFNFSTIWNINFKWIWEKIKVYAFDYNNSHKNEYIDQVKVSWELKKEKELVFVVNQVDRFVFKVASVWAILVTQPIPFVDMGLIFWLQVYMTVEIWKLYWIDLDKKVAYGIVTSLLWSLWFEYTKYTLQIQAMKIWLPWVWWYIQIPLAFAMVYSFWKLISYYFYLKSIWKDISFINIKDYFFAKKTDAIEMWKKRKKEIMYIWKKNLSLLKPLFKKYKK